MGDYMDGLAFRKNLLGRKVDRATATLPQTTAAAIFTITTGRVVLTSIIGEVTVIVQTQANATKLVSNPTVGTDVDLCATLDITAAEVGALLGITGTVGDALALAAAGGGATYIPRGPWLVLPVGTIDLNCAASNTGSIKWSCTYFPYDDGAAIVAA